MGARDEIVQCYLRSRCLVPVPSQLNFQPRLRRGQGQKDVRLAGSSSLDQPGIGGKAVSVDDPRLGLDIPVQHLGVVLEELWDLILIGLEDILDRKSTRTWLPNYSPSVVLPTKVSQGTEK